jgi:drug/metabolite transporter (DMT)-like permease
VPTGRTAGFTTAALVAFAANSWLCRFALRGGDIDPTCFTALRLASGAAILWPLARALEPKGARGGSWPAGVALFVYALAFSLAYVALDTGVGALLLFGAVQATMIGAALRQGERLGWRQWFGLFAALGGLGWLAAPGFGAPPAVLAQASTSALAGTLFMGTAGIAWGVYSLLGRGRPHPFATTSGNFLRAAPLAIAALGVATLVSPGGHATTKGVLLAVASGAVTSGIGYVVWHAALRDLAASTAGLVQLAVPALAAAGGVVLLGERPTPRLALAAALILGGVALAVARRTGTPHS